MKIIGFAFSHGILFLTFLQDRVISDPKKKKKDQGDVEVDISALPPNKGVKIATSKLRDIDRDMVEFERKRRGVQTLEAAYLSQVKGLFLSSV